MFCYKCNGIIKHYEGGWACRHCRQHGANSTPVNTLRQGVVENRPLSAPYTQSDIIQAKAANQ